MERENLREKTISGVGWTFAEIFFRYGVSFIVGIILARLLSPDEYGLIGILTIFIAVFDIIVDGGFANALIQKKDVTDIDYCTVFYSNLLLSLIMAIILYVSAPLISYFFERDELLSLTRVMSIIIILNAAASIQRTRLSKQLSFKKQTIICCISSLVSGIIGVSMAYYGCGVWALVSQQISYTATNACLLWFLGRWIPKLIFSFESFKSLWNFGWKLLASGLLNTFSTQIFNIVIGKCFAPSTLGQYTWAQQFGSLFSSNITNVIQKVTFPVFSKIQDNPIRLKDSYRKVIKVTMLPTFVLMIGLAAISNNLVLILIGDQWTDVASYLQILCFSLMLYPLNSLNTNAIQVMGRSDITLKINILKNILIVIPVSIGIMCGIYWMLFFELLRIFICYLINAYFSKPLINYSIVEQIKDILPDFAIAVVVSIPVFLLNLVPVAHNIILPFQIILGICLFIYLCEVFKLEEYIEIKSICFSILKKYSNSK